VGSFPSIKLLPRVFELTWPPTDHITQQKKLVKFKALCCSDLAISSVLISVPCSSSGTEIVF